MSFEFLLPLIGAGACAALTYRAFAPQNRAENPTFVEDEVPLAAIKGETLVLTRTEQMFKVVELAGQSVAGKRSDDLEKAASARALFYRNVSENKVHLRIVSQKTLFPAAKKAPCGNPFLDEMGKRWENRLETSFRTRHFVVVSAVSEAEIDAVVREIFTALAELEPKVLTKSGKDGVSPLLSFLSSFYNAGEIPVSDAETNIHRIERSRIKIERTGLITQTFGAVQTFRLVFGIKDFGEDVSAKIYDGVLALPYPMTVSTHVQPVAKSAALANLDKRRSQMNLGRKEFNTQANEEIKSLRDKVDSDKLSLANVELTVFLNLSDKAHIHKAAQDVYGVLGRFGVRPVLEEQLAMPKFWGQTPGRDYFNRELLLTSSNLADLCPMTRAETGLTRCDWGDRPVCRFPSVPSGNPFGFTFHATAEDQAPPHCAVFAPTGSGKTVLILHLVAQALAAYPDLSVFMLDRDNGVTVFTDLVGGTYHQISQDGEISLNPFDCKAGEETTLNLFMQILTNAETEAEKKDIRIFVSEMLKQPRFNRRMDLYAAELAPNGAFKDKLEKWVKGSTLNAKLFNGEKDTLDVTKSRLNVFGLDNVKDDADAAAALFFYLFKKIERNAQSGKPSLLIVDEAPTLLSSAPLKAEIEKLLKTARKQRMAIFMAFQGTNDLKTLNIKETILTNCHTRFFYDGCAGTAEEIDGFNLTESETEFVLTKGAKIEGAKRPVLMQRNRLNVFLETDMSCLGEYLNAFKGGAKTVRFWNYAKRNAENPTEYFLKRYGDAR